MAGSRQSMTGRERYRVTLGGGKPDKLPLILANYNGFINHYYGVSVRDYLDRPASTAEVIARFVREFQFDQFLAAVGYILYGCGPELGVRWDWPADNFPAAVEGPFRSEEDVERFQIPVEPSGYFESYLEMVRLINRSVGDDLHVSANLLGPFSVACFLRGFENVLVDTKLDLPFFQKYMARSVELSRHYIGKHLLSVLPTPSFNEIFITPEMMSPAFHHRFVEPFDREVCEHLGLPNHMAAIMGRAGDEASQRAGRYAYNAIYGVNDSLEDIEKAAEHQVPGRPLLVTVSGRMLFGWPVEDILRFVSEGVALVTSRGRYPAISMTSVQPDSPESARDVAEKLRAIAELRDSLRIE